MSILTTPRDATPTPATLARLTATDPGTFAHQIDTIMRAYGWCLAYRTDVYPAGCEGYVFGGVEGEATDARGVLRSVAIGPDGVDLDADPAAYPGDGAAWPPSREADAGPLRRALAAYVTGRVVTPYANQRPDPDRPLIVLPGGRR